MLRIAGTLMPEEKHIEIALTYVYGIGRSLAKKILSEAGVEGSKKVKDLQEEEISRIRAAIEGKYKVEGDLKREIISNIRRLKQIRCWRGLRHIKKLPVRGQKTEKNARTARGNVKRTSVAFGKKKAPARK